MRIGTITLHAGFNEGAILQSLALQRAIARLRPEADVEIVDHRCKQLLEVIYGPARTPRQKILEEFYTTRLPLSERSFLSDDPKPTFAYIAGRYDAVVVGSDEVWKVNYQRRLKGLIRIQRDPNAPAFPNVFWPDQSVRAKRFSYAATIGTRTNWLNIPERRRREMREILMGFEAIGVRDERTEAFVRWLEPSLEARMSWTPDPTFAEPLNGEAEATALAAKLAAAGVDFSRKRLLVIAKTDATSAAVIEMFRAKGYQIVGITEKNGAVDLDLSEAALSPLEWAGLGRHFDACVTERMHGCIFALLNETPVISIERRPASMGHKTKNDELMFRLGLSDFYLLGGADRGADGKTASACSRVIEGRWPRDEVRATVQRFQEIGRNFLQKSLPERPAKAA